MNNKFKKALGVGLDKVREEWDDIDENECVEIFDNPERNKKSRDDMIKYITLWCKYNFPDNEGGPCGKE